MTQRPSALPRRIPVREPSDRNPLGWIALALLFLAAVPGLFKAPAVAPPDAARLARLQRLRTALAESARPAGPLNGDPKAGLRALEREVAPRRGSDPDSAALWTAVRTELHEKVSPEDARPALESPRPDIRDVGRAYGLRPAPKREAEALARTLDARGPLSRLAAVHLREAAGLPDPRRDLRDAAERFALGTRLYGAVIGLSGFAWLGLIAVALSGRVPKRGPPYAAESPADADRLALCAAGLLLGFEVFSAVFALLRLPLPGRVLATGLAMFALVPVVLRKRPSFEGIVRARADFGGKLLLGVYAFFLEIPVTLLVAAFGARIFRSLPTSEHPAAVAAASTHDPLVLASLLFMAAVVAPFWEEIMFRGLLFPALGRALGGRALNAPVAAALLSSLLFAALHPQGPGGWLGLMAFAVCSCVLAVRTGSLVPSIAMHAVHNATLLLLATLVG